MSIASTTALVTGQISEFETQALIVLGVVVVISVAIFGYNWAKRKFFSHAK